jgi:hypothetical protein
MKHILLLFSCRRCKFFGTTIVKYLTFIYFKNTDIIHLNIWGLHHNLSCSRSNQENRINFFVRVNLFLSKCCDR